MLGIRIDTWAGDERPAPVCGWDETQRRSLLAKVEALEAFLDFPLSRTHEDGSVQTFRVSGEPMFNTACRFLGYRGIGVEVTAKLPPPNVVARSVS
jgi:hypothetical protein